MNNALQFPSFNDHINDALLHIRAPALRRFGVLTRIVGLTIEAKGIAATVGSICRILKYSAVSGAEQSDKAHYVDAQVVGFESGTLYMMPLWDAVGLQAGAKTYLLSETDSAPVGNELLGRVVDALGEPLDGLAEIRCNQKN
jgi:flagellum-specific ATP synthase